MINPIKTNIGLGISLNMNKRYYSLETLKRHCRCNQIRVLLDENSVLTMQLPQHCTCKYETPLSVHNCVGPAGTKAVLESKNNSHESEMVPTTNSILTQRQVGCWCW